MKKLLLLSSALALVSSGFAQLDAIQNPNFDTWTANEPNNWGSSNSAYTTLSVTGSVSKATGLDVVGPNTLMLTTQPTAGSPVPGIVVSNGTVSLSGNSPVVKGGFTYRIRPIALTYICKYASGGGSDAPMVQVVLTRWNATTHKRDTLGVSRSTTAGTTYAKQTLNISYSKTPIGGNPTTIVNYAKGSASPDTVQIMIASSGTGAVANSTFFIDSLKFEYNCDLDPAIHTSGTNAVLLPADGTTLTAVAGQPFSFKVTSFIPKSVIVDVPFNGANLGLSTTVDSVQITSNSLSGSAAGFFTIDPNPTNGKTGGNSISCLSFSGTIPATPANATYNLILTPTMWGTSIVADLQNFPSPQTNTYYIKVGTGSDPLTSTNNEKWRTMMYNGQKRVYNVYVPSMYDGSKAVPLVFNIHGWTGSTTKQMDFGDFRKIADTANFIIVQPQATGDIPSWDLTGTTDTDFLMALLDQLESEYKIDTNRVYSTGFSQGGMMSYLFACFHSTRIAAVAPVAGGMTSTTVTDCKPTHYMPLMEVHGTTDQLASYTGSTTSPGVQTLLNYWVKINKCNATAVKTTLPNINTGDLCTVEHFVYDGGTDNANVEHYKITDGGHEWPTLTPGKFNYGLGNRNLDFDASKEIWRFFSGYSLDKLGSTGISEIDPVENNVSISPNPSNGVFTLKTKDFLNGKLRITDVVGKVVFETTLKAELTSIDLKNSGKGIYIYQVQGQSGAGSSGKIIIE